MTSLAEAVAARNAAIERGPVAPVVYVRPSADVLWNPTPTAYECSQIATGLMPLGRKKVWDTSPIAAGAFDGATPPLPGHGAREHLAARDRAV
jgi:hypothetical protein